MSFFAPAGVVLLALILRYLPGERPAAHAWLVLLFVVALAALLGLGAYGRIGDGLARLRLPHLSAWLDGDFSAGYPLWDVLNVRFGLRFEWTRKLLPAAAGLLAGLAIAGLGLRLGRNSGGASAAMARALLLAGILLSPTPILGNGFQSYDCGQDTLAGYEQVGRELAGIITGPQQVYWRGGKSIVPLLYVPEAAVYPPQINGDYTLYGLDDSDLLLKFGLWNEALSDRLLAEADTVLIEAAAYRGELRDSVDAAGLVAVGRTPAPYTCRPDAEILVFRQP
jgi:hypothetical protein